MRRLHIVLVAAAALAACGDGTRPIAELARAQARWVDHGPSSYSITILRGCECLPEMSGPVVVVVREGRVESRRYVPSGGPVDATFEDLFPTVDGLFGLIADAAQQDSARLEVTYHPTLGYPTSIVIDYHPVYVDDEVYYYISNFEPESDPALAFTVLGHTDPPAALTVRRVGHEIRVLGSLKSPCSPYDAAGRADRRGHDVVLEVVGRASRDCPQDVVSPLGYRAVVTGVGTTARLTIIHRYADANWPDTTVFHGVPEPSP